MTERFEREHRLALVLNGGVSLAVWMAGAVYEIDLLRRASAPRPDAGDGDGHPTRPELAYWRELCAPTDGRPAHRVIVDVIAGTSAGGLNGSLLATAIAKGGSLNPPAGDHDPPAGDHDPPSGDHASSDPVDPWLRRTWVNLASLATGRLLPVGAGPRSLLNGDYFAEAVATALGELGGDDPDAAGPVTLFVTATAVGTSERAYRDGFGGAFTVADHRRLYRFERAHDALVYRHPDGVWDDDLVDAVDGYFHDDVHNDFQSVSQIALAARASASFPVAFSPVRESGPLNAVPPRVLPAGECGANWLVDGGVLDNAPFGPVLDAVSRRAVSGPVERLLVYVVPSNGTPADAEPIPDAGPSLTRVVEEAVFGLAREADFRADIEQLQALLRDDDLAWADTQRWYARMLAHPADRQRYVEAARRLLPMYRRASAARGVWQARPLDPCGVGNPAGSPLSPVHAIGDGDVDAILAGRPCWVPGSDASLDGPLPGTRPWRWGIPAAERAVLLMVRYLRDLFDSPGHTVLATAHAGPKGGHAGATVVLAKHVAVADLQLRRIVAVRDAVDDRLTGCAAGWTPSPTLAKHSAPRPGGSRTPKRRSWHARA